MIYYAVVEIHRGFFLECQKAISYPFDLFHYSGSIPGQYQLRQYSSSCLCADSRGKDTWQLEFE